MFSRGSFGDVDRTRRIASQWAALVGLIGAAVAAIGLIWAPWIVKSLFERGSFGVHDTERVATLLRYGVLQLPFYLAGLVFVSLHSSRGGYRVILFSGLLGLSLKMVTIWLLVGSLGLPALMISAAVMYLGNMLLLRRLT